MNKIRFGIIGCGVIAPTHIWALEENKDAQLTALCDTNRERREKLAEGKDVTLFNSWQDMLASPEIDAVTICLPHYLHAPAFIDALEAGKHVICEKPMGINREQLLSMKKAAQKAADKGILSGGIFQHRFSPLVEEVLKILEEDIMGDIEKAQLNFLCTRDINYYQQDAWRGKWETEGGGLLINQAIHTIDLLIQLLGMPTAVKASLFREKLDCIEVEDRTVGTFYYGSDSKVKSKEISLSLENDLATSWQPEIILKGSRATLELKGSEEFTCTDRDITTRLAPFAGEEGKNAPGKACYGSLHSQNFSNFISSVKSGTKPQVTIESLADSTEAVLAIYQSHYNKRKESLPLTGWTQPQGLNKENSK